MRSTKKYTTKDAGWDARLDSTDTAIKRTAKRQLAHKTRQTLKTELRNMADICVCCGEPLGNAELGTLICKKCEMECY